jgi:hypothetical protein
MSIVVCKLPRAGLGNQLFPLMKAFVLGEINNLPVVVIGYNQLKIGPYLRKEKSKRKYHNYFNFQKNLLGEQFDKWRILNNKYLHQTEPIIEYKAAGESILYKYEAIPHWDDYFDQLKQYRQLVIELFNKQVKKNIHVQVQNQSSPKIGVHIRMGDFRKLKAGEEFSKVGAVRTPEQYFIDIINKIREIHGTCLPVSVFTDGYKYELEKLFQLNNINIVEGNSDIVDMLLLSKSKIIVCSAGSTFSYWAGFLANAPLIMHPDHIHESIRPKEINEFYYEGSWDGDNPILIHNILNIEA